MNIPHLLAQLQDTTLSQAIRSGRALAAPVSCHRDRARAVSHHRGGLIVMVDIAAARDHSRDSSVSRLSHEVLPWTWVAFAVSGP